jgi:hypothetical protein
LTLSGVRGAVSLIPALWLAVTGTASAQTGFGGFGGQGGRGQPKLKITSRFDENNDGRLNDAERQAARGHARSIRGRQTASQLRSIKSDFGQDLLESAASAPLENTDLYDEGTLRTLYLRFPNEDWFSELSDFYHTDVEVPADLIVDGNVYASVGVRFRGNSSYFTISGALKKSFTVSIDHEDPDQRLYGYRTLDLLNSHADPSFLREVLFSRISRQYIPTSKANFVRLVINGESWGVYINLQQFNNDFLQDWFGTNEGVRWKVPAGRRGAGGLAYSGPDPSAYRSSFELKTEDSPDAWRDLIELSEILSETPDNRLEAELSTVFDIDGALWFIALENVFIDSDGYISRGSDYSLYQDPYGRFHMISRDNNETFKYAGGGGPNRWPSSDPMLSPLGHENNPALPVISRLLAIPHLRARYLDHIRTIVSEWLDWDVLGPIIEGYRSLIADDVRADEKKLYSYTAFANSLDQSDVGGGGGRGGFSRGLPSFKEFVAERREFLLSHAEIGVKGPVIKSVALRSIPVPGKPVWVTAAVDQATPVESVFLYYANERDRSFERILMYDDGAHLDEKRGDGIYGGEIAPFSGGTVVLYYVEARSATSSAATVFEPAATEWGAHSYNVAFKHAESTPVVINELMALNTSSLLDPQGGYDDWIELHNSSDAAIDITGMYLSDKENNPRKWTFPEGTIRG